MTGTPLEVSVIVCTRNRNAELARCLTSLRSLDPGAREIIVVNSAGSPEASAIAAKFNARYCATESPGVSSARNAGIAAAQFPLLAFIDDDAVAEPAWLLRLSTPFADPGVGATSGVVRPLGECGPWGERYFASAFGVCREHRIDRDTHDWFWKVNTGDAGIGTNMMFRREALRAESAFDTRLGRGAPIAGNEEHFAFFHAVLKGFRCMQTPEAIVQHPCLSTAGEVRQFELQMAEIAGAYLALLYTEYPAYRMEIVRHVAGRLGGGRGVNSNMSPVSLVSRTERLRAMWRGMRTYHGIS